MAFAAPSDAARLMRAPAREYRLRVAARRAAPWSRALTVPVLLMLMIGLLNSTAAVGHIAGLLVLDQIVSWSFIPAVQLLTGMALIASAKTRLVTFPRAVELLFAAHGPWSLWLVAVTLLQTIYPDPYVVVASGVVPLAASAFMLNAFAREVLGLSVRQARRRVMAHQAVTVLLAAAYIELASRLFVRILGAVAA